ncbi:MAG TPA: NRDE family protein, partial [Thermoanaerobaculia bacterium]
MCVIYLAFRAHSRYRLAVAANRDEFHDRPTAGISEWEDEPGMIAGRDLRSGGTWMGVHARGRFAALTNFREPLPQAPDAPSRGALVASYLAEGGEPARWLDSLAPRATFFAGFSLFVSDLETLGHFSNR